MTYIFAIHIPIAGISLLPVLFRLPLVLLPLNIVFLELIIDPACSIAFESEPEHPQIMKRRPRDPKARMFSRETVIFSISQGLGLLLVTLAAFLISLARDKSEMEARAMTFTTLVIGNIAMIWANRSRTRTIPQILRAPNRPLWLVSTGALLLLAVVLYVPAARRLFQFSTLHVDDMIVCLILGLSSVTWYEAMKWRSGRRNGHDLGV
jgi:Ca2+-transporting ATPase